jgi:hypothetical protein
MFISTLSLIFVFIILLLLCEGVIIVYFISSVPRDQDTVSHPKASQSQQKRKIIPNKCSKNFTLTEYETLCSAYLNVSKDPIVGVNQSMQSYWVRITDYYNDNRKNVIEKDLELAAA